MKNILLYIDKLYYIVNKYCNTSHRTIKIKPLGVTLSTYVDSSKEIDNKVPKFKIGDLTISEYKNIFEKVMFWIGLKKFLWLNKI